MLPVFHIRDTIDMLLNNGANPITVNEDGDSPLIILEEVGPNRRLICWKSESEPTKEKCEAVQAEIKGLLRRYRAGEAKPSTSSDTLSQVVAQLTVMLIEILTNDVGIGSRDHQIAVSSSAQFFRGWKFHPAVASVTLQDNRTIEQEITDFLLARVGQCEQDMANSGLSQKEHTRPISSSSETSLAGDLRLLQAHDLGLVKAKPLEDAEEYGGLPPSQSSKNCSHYLHRLTELQQRLFNVNRCLYYIDSNPDHGSGTIGDLITKATGQQSHKVQRLPWWLWKTLRRDPVVLASKRNIGYTDTISD